MTTLRFNDYPLTREYTSSEVEVSGIQTDHAVDKDIVYTAVKAAAARYGAGSV